MRYFSVFTLNFSIQLQYYLCLVCLNIQSACITDTEIFGLTSAIMSIT